MADFQITVGDPESGQAYRREIDGQDANRFIGKSIGDEVDGAAVGLEGYTITVTGGSDVAGRPMREDVSGPTVKRVLVTGGTGYNPKRDGERKRLSIRGREISDETSQINVKVSEYGESSIEELYGEGGDDEDSE